MGFRHFRIIPILVFVAMLSFSVRLIEVFQGLDDFSGAAYAVEKVDSDMAHKEDHDKKMDSKSMDSMGADDLGENFFSDETVWNTDVKPDLGLEGDFPNWRDSTDEDVAYENSRMEVFKDLSARRQSIEKKERELETRMALLKAAEQELNQKYNELSRLRKELEGLLVQQSEEEKERTKSLVKIYEGMKPKDAARIFNTLDLDILVDVVAQMSERKLSPILAAMNAERARTITIMLAEQKQLPSLP